MKKSIEEIYIENKLQKDCDEFTVKEIKNNCKKYTKKSKWNDVYLVGIDKHRESYYAIAYLLGYGFTTCSLTCGKISGAVFKSGGKNYRISDFK